MNFKHIICLANSIKKGGRCVAGKEVKQLSWLRPITNEDYGQLPLRQIRYKNGELPEPLDIIRVPFTEWDRKPYQPENFLISSNQWEKIGEYPIENLEELCDEPETLWFNGGDKNDRIPKIYFINNKISSSLYLIQPEKLNIVVKEEFDKRKIHAVFDYCGDSYDLNITDPVIKQDFKSDELGEYHYESEDIFLSVSISEMYKDYYWKLVAAIIRREY